jgi:DNA mismatch repair protein MutL
VEKEAVMNSVSLLERLGFELEDFGGNEVRLTALPANLLGLSGEDVFSELVTYITSGIEGVTEDIFIRKLATMGCKAAIKGNQKITFPEVQALLKELLKLDNPYTCPHGRPTIIRMTKEELDKKFKRIVEG